MPFDALEASGRPVREQVEAMVADIGILEDTVLNALIRPNSDDGLYGLYRRFITIHGSGLDLFLRHYLRAFPPAERTWGERLGTGLASRLRAAFEEEAMNMHTKVMIEGLAGESVTLGELARQVCEDTDRNFDRKRAQLGRTYLAPMHELMLWEVTETRRAYRNGNGDTPSFKIRPGEAALHFHHLVFKPIMLRQLRNYLGDLEGGAP